MDEQARVFYELRFRAQFLESKAAAFQDLFVDIMSKAHLGDFIPCRPWGKVGDRKNDGYLKSERILFQVYAPNEMREAETISKVERDFAEALPYWRDYFDTWVFVHNADRGLPPGVIAKLLELERLHAPIKVTHWGFEELVLRFRRLSLEALCSLYGSPPPGAEMKKTSEAHSKVELAQELVRGGKQSEAIKEMTEALAIARAAGDEEEEVEILLGLALLSSERRGPGDRLHYFQEAEKKVDKLKSSAAKVIYLRARATDLEEKGDLGGAEDAYRAALHCCRTEPEDDKGNLATQGCIVRSSFVHFLCHQKRLEEARPLLAECENYARQNKDAEEGELLQAALEAGIHFSLEAGDEDEAILRITELEQSANTSRLANRVGSDLVNVANQASHRQAHRAALAAAEASIRLGRRCEDLWPGFLVGALYTEAMVIAKAGDDEKALSKAEAILDLCQRPEDAIMKQATQALIAEIRRSAGDSQSAVDLARQALAAARGRPEDIAFFKLALARALNDNGQTEEALKEAKEAWTLARPARIPARGAVEFLSQIISYGSQLAAETEVAGALAELEHVPDESDEVKASKKRAVARAVANRELRRRLLGVYEHAEPAVVAGTTECRSLPEANAVVVRPLLGLWEDMPQGALAGSYDFWGRGNFERILLNARCFPNSFNVMIEVRSLDDVKRAVRLWSLYADFLVLVWKGPTRKGLATVPLPEDYEEPGGWGYMIAAGDVLRKEGSRKTWHPALAHVSLLPDDVAAFLATEARPFVQAGRLIIVPALGAGCINPGHGPFEQLLAEAANAIPSIRWKGFEGSPIGYLPYSPNAPLELLAELADAESDRLRRLRLLLLKRSRELKPDRQVGLAAKTLSLEIDEALRDLEDRNVALARKRGLEKAKEPLSGATARFRSSGERLTGATSDSSFAPLLILQNLGYGWRVEVEGAQVPPLPSRFEPQEGDVVGTWLAPPSAGWIIPTGVVPTPSE